MNPSPVRILVVEDSTEDFELIRIALRRRGLDAQCWRVETETQLRDMLDSRAFDCILTDHDLEGMNSLDVLQIFNEYKLDVPFIIVSGAIGEETAVAAMRAGAHDYINKNRIARLVPAIERELKEARVRAQEREQRHQLALNEERYRVLFELDESIGYILCQTDTNQLEFEWTTSIYELTGHHLGPGAGLSDFLQLVHSDDVGRVRRYFQQVHRGNESAIEYRLLSVDNRVLWFQNLARLMIDSTGNKKIVGAARNITKQKQAQAALEIQTREYETIFNSAPSLIYYRDLDNRILQANARLKNWYEACRLPVPVDQIFHLAPQQVEEMAREDLEIMQTGQPMLGLIKELHHPDWGHRWLRVDKVPHFDDQGHIDGIIVFILDITRQKLAEQQLDSFFHLSRDLFCISDFGGKIQYVNPAWEQTLGYTPGEMNSKWIQQFQELSGVSREWIPASSDARTSSHTDTPSYFSAEQETQDRNGQVRWLQWRGVAIPSERQVFAVAREVTAQRLSQEALKQSEELLDHFFRLSNDGYGIILFDEPLRWDEHFDRDELEACLARLKITRANEALSNQMGIPEDVLIGSGFQDFPREDIRNELDFWVHLFNTGSMRLEQLFKRNRSRETWWICDHVCLYTSEGLLRGCFWVQHDITSQKQLQRSIQQMNQTLEQRVAERTDQLSRANEDLIREVRRREVAQIEQKRTQNLLRAIIDHSQALIFMKDLKGRYLMVNDTFQKHLNLQEYQIIGRRDEDLFDRSTAHQFRENDLRVVQLQEATQVEECVNHEGHVHTYFVLKFPVYDHDGKFYAICGMAIDITLEKESREQLRRSELRFRLLVNNMTDIICQQEQDLSISYISPSVRDILGYTPMAALYLDLRCLIHAEDQRKWKIAYARLRRRQTNQETIRYRLKMSNERWVWVETRVKCLLDDENNILGYQSATRDISRQIKAEKELLQALDKESRLRRMKAQFISMASHQINTPLTTFNTIVNIQKELIHEVSPELRQRFEQHSERLQSQTQNLQNLMNELLVLNKAESGIMHFNPKPVDLVALCRSACQEAQETARESREIAVEVKGKPVPVPIDTTMMVHILGNLLSNAYKYSPHRPAPQLRITYYKRRVGLEVEDYGIGVPESEITRIFESFYRASNTQGINGTGMGLVIVKKLTEAHGGALFFESQCGRGSRFQLFIPYQQKEPERIHKLYKNNHINKDMVEFL